MNIRIKKLLLKTIIRVIDHWIKDLLLVSVWILPLKRRFKHQQLICPINVLNSCKRCILEKETSITWIQHWHFQNVLQVIGQLPQNANQEVHEADGVQRFLVSFPLVFHNAGLQCLHYVLRPAPASLLLVLAELTDDVPR